MLLSLAKSIQAWQGSAWLAGSTWAYPAIGALHVLGIAWFGGAVLLACLCRDNALAPRRAFMWAGGALMLASGALLFVTEPVRCVSSYAFGAKMLLLLGLVALHRLRVTGMVMLALWIGVLLASRAIAYL